MIMKSTTAPRPFVILIAPNVSERMGGEAIKSLQILQILQAEGWDVHQITHARVRAELEQRFPDYPITYVRNSWVQWFCWRSVIFNGLVPAIFLWHAARLARKLAAGRSDVVVHINSPTSPVMPVFRLSGLPTIFGPLNANPYHPPAFLHREPWRERFRRWLHQPIQKCRRLLPFKSGKQSIDVLLIAGGDRTKASLLDAGCRPEQFRATLDSGIAARFADSPRIKHSGVNFRFVHVARLIPFKAADLAIKGLARTELPIELDIIGSGPLQQELEELVSKLGLQKRVRFLGQLDHAHLIDRLHEYRAFVLPSLAESNGIVFQEAMMLGLPSICLDWGGPADLITSACGFLIPPTSEEDVIAGIATALDRLAEDGELAESMSINGRERAIREGYSWLDLIRNWSDVYLELSNDIMPCHTVSSH